MGKTFFYTTCFFIGWYIEYFLEKLSTKLKKDGYIYLIKMRKILLLFISNILYGQLPQASNLIGSYSFTGNANDSSGNNYNGTFTGNPSLTDDRNGVLNSTYTLEVLLTIINSN